MKAISINAAKSLGEKSGAARIVILALDGIDYNVTTWGRTTKDCRALRAWAESLKAVSVLGAIADAKPSRGVTTIAVDPAATSELGVK